jgi:hypothetical protein
VNTNPSKSRIKNQWESLCAIPNDFSFVDQHGIRSTGIAFPVKVVRDLAASSAEFGRKSVWSLRQRLPMHGRLSASMGG